MIFMLIHKYHILCFLSFPWFWANLLVCFIFPGGPLLLMELAFLLRSVGTEVFWITIQKPSETDEVVYSLEQKMLVRGVQVITVLAPEVV
jgi:hypothetical protein